MAGERDRDEVARLVREWMDAARRKDLPAMRALCPRGTIKVADEALNINDESTLARLLLFPEEPLLAPAKPDVTIDGDAAGVEPHPYDDAPREPPRHALLPPRRRRLARREVPA